MSEMYRIHLNGEWSPTLDREGIISHIANNSRLQKMGIENSDIGPVAHWGKANFCELLQISSQEEK